MKSHDAAILYFLAKRKNPRVASWYGARGGSSRRTYLCYLCRCTIDTESARNRMTKHAATAIRDHGAMHLEEIGDENLKAARAALAAGADEIAHEILVEIGAAP